MEVKLKWVPGHLNVEGNKRADELAKQGSSTLPRGLEHYLELSKKKISQHLNKLNLGQIEGCWQTKDSIKDPRGSIDKRHFWSPYKPL